MRSKLSKILIVCALMAGAMTPALACNFHVEASADHASQQTAQAQPSTDADAN